MSRAGDANRGLQRSTAVVVSGLLAVGVVLALVLVDAKLGLEFDPGFESSCALGPAFDCDAVQTSRWASIDGRPLALLGAITYVYLIGLAWLAARQSKRRFTYALILASALLGACASSLFLLYVSSARIGTQCLYCLGMHAVNFSTAALVLRDLRRGGHPKLAGWCRASAMAGLAALAWAGAAYALLLGAGLTAYSTWRSGIAQARIEEARASIAAVRAREQWGSGPLPELGSVGGFEQTPVGRTYFDAPIARDDYVRGRRNAPVRIVQFVDLSCRYCRALHSNLEPVREKYASRVLWVFKHFPLNAECNAAIQESPHVHACEAAWAAECAGAQGRFWEMHDRLLEDDRPLTPERLHYHASRVVIDLATWDACVRSDEPRSRVRRHVAEAVEAGVRATPRTYVNGHLVAGVAAPEVVSYYIEATAAVPGPSNTVERYPERMLPVGSDEQRTYIDPYESSLGSDGAAVSRSGVVPAEVSWFEAQRACRAAGKRMCRVEEWAAACSGSPPADRDGDGLVSRTELTGAAYSYGPVFRPDVCNVSKVGAMSGVVETGAFPDCRAPNGAYDMNGNRTEWTGNDPSTAALAGSFFGDGYQSTCESRPRRFGPGYRSEATGFRCCADTAAPPPTTGSDTRSRLDSVHAPLETLATLDGGTLAPEDLEGRPTVLVFFASWCGPCLRALLELEELNAIEAASGLRLVAIGVDRDAAASAAFARALKLTYPVGLDPTASWMARFEVTTVPEILLFGTRGGDLTRVRGFRGSQAEELRRALARMRPDP